MTAGACTGKERYTKKEAAGRVRWLRQKFDPAIDSYKCSFCNWFHIGHSTRPRRRRRGHGR